MNILIDADGCPVVDLTLQIAKQFGMHRNKTDEPFCFNCSTVSLHRLIRQRHSSI